jgi:hypothetical protein
MDQPGEEASDVPNGTFHNMPVEPARQQSSVHLSHQMSAVYEDDFLLVAVEESQGMLLARMARATIHAIHSVFPLPRATGMLDTKDLHPKRSWPKGTRDGQR